MFSYLDAGTGSALIGLAAGGAAGVAVAAKMYGHRALGVVSKKHRAKAENTPDELDNADSGS